MLKLLDRYFHGVYELSRFFGNPTPETAVFKTIFSQQIFGVLVLIIRADDLPLSEIDLKVNFWILFWGVIGILASVNFILLKKERYIKQKPFSKSDMIVIHILYLALEVVWNLSNSCLQAVQHKGTISP